MSDTFRKALMMFGLHKPIISLGAVVLLTAVAVAHPFHISVAELEYNAQSQKLEVSLKLHATDFERALAKRFGKDVDLEGDVFKDGKLATEYLDSHFYLVSAADAAKEASDREGAASAEGLVRSKCHFVGSEVKQSWMWLYFEMEVPEVEGDLALFNTVLLDLTDGQINTATVRHDSKRHALKTTAKNRWSEFSKQWLTPRGPAPSGK